ncbi:MAG: DUF4342 domain-containing protein [Oscillospiraceae bacterium]|jgi:hypothetical protein|nr:DUF4342 domain-containing protein [Oscillospiraceae bacterium]
MNKEQFEKIEYLRANAEIGYEEAAALLERYDGDLTRAMIELERANRLRPAYDHGENPWDNAAHGKDEKHRHRHEHDHCRHNPDSWFKKLMRAKLQITKDGETVATVPAVVPIVAAVVAPYLAIGGAAVGAVTGYRVKTTQPPEKDGGEN